MKRFVFDLTHPTMDASDMTPPQIKMRSINKRQHIPAEMVEEILLNLPVKSLVRFSSVSKSWNSTILESGFVKRYRSRRAALPGRERIVGTEFVSGRGSEMIVEDASTCLISSISSSNNPTVDATDFECPFGNPYEVVASCGELWLGQRRSGNAKSLLLWNPSMRRYKHVPNSSSNMEFDVVFGLGYECVGDDYKILKISYARTRREFGAQLYSLRSDSWRNITACPTRIGRNYGGCALVSSKLHLLRAPYAPPPALVCFDLTTDKFGEVALPNYSLQSQHLMHLSVLRGMLCVSINYFEKYCEIWVMEEYGVAGSWTKMFSIAYFSNTGYGNSIRPLYLYENGEILIRYFDGTNPRMFVYNEDDKSRAREVFIRSSSSSSCKTACRFVYVDSLVAP